MLCLVGLPPVLLLGGTGAMLNSEGSQRLASGCGDGGVGVDSGDVKAAGGHYWWLR